jgi:Kef-type K+ transport system membrane component KefB
MSNSALGSLAFFLFITLLSAHFLGNRFVRIRQPKVIGEILAGVLMGPSILGHFWQVMPSASISGANSLPTPLELCYWIGLLLLMFFSGAEIQHLFRRDDNREITLLALLGTGLPFIIALGLASLIKLQPLAGKVGTGASLTLVVGIAVAVTSIPVISRIFHDLGILHTRFARMVLGVAVIEDIALWAVLAIATALAKSQPGIAGSLPMAHISREIITTLIFFALGLTLVPRLVQRFHNARWNSLSSASPAAYLLILLFAYVAVAAALNVSLVFAAFLAGLAVPRAVEGDPSEASFCEALKSVKTVSFSVFIPIYFALVGYKIDWGKSFSLSMLLLFLAGACLIKLASVTLGAYAAGFRGMDAVNLAVATNARGGPGIVLASVAFDAQIISPAFYTTLILVAVFTSQAAGAWLEYVLRKGWPLLSGSQEESAPEAALQPVPVQRAA